MSLSVTESVAAAVAGRDPLVVEDEENAGQCAGCQEPYPLMWDIAREWPCDAQHVMCVTCTRGWLLGCGAKTCPTCREVIPEVGRTKLVSSEARIRACHLYRLWRSQRVCCRVCAASSAAASSAAASASPAPSYSYEEWMAHMMREHPRHPQVEAVQEMMQERASGADATQKKLDTIAAQVRQQRRDRQQAAHAALLEQIAKEEWDEVMEDEKEGKLEEELTLAVEKLLLEARRVKRHCRDQPKIHPPTYRKAIKLYKSAHEFHMGDHSITKLQKWTSTFATRLNAFKTSLGLS